MFVRFITFLGSVAVIAVLIANIIACVCERCDAPLYRAGR
jgi:hypothetical protein